MVIPSLGVYEEAEGYMVDILLCALVANDLHIIEAFSFVGDLTVGLFTILVDSEVDSVGAHAAFNVRKWRGQERSALGMRSMSIPNFLAVSS